MMRRPHVPRPPADGLGAIASLCLAALRSPTPNWAGAIFITTCGVLAFGVVGVLCGKEADRPWWLGFAVFGWGYLIVHWVSLEQFWPATGVAIELLRRLMAKLGARSPEHPISEFKSSYFVQIGHYLWALLFASLGGLLARLVFAPSVRPSRAR